MVDYKNKGILGLIGVLLLFAIIALPTMGSVSLWEIDEGRYLVPARNAIEHGKWLIPEYNGGPRIQKPPLMVWLVAASSILVNKGRVNEFSARLPSFLAAVGTLIILFLLVKYDTQREDLALISTLLLSTSYLFVRHARFAITDMVLLFFITSSIAAGVAAVRKKSTCFCILSFLSAGLGFMTKGPVGVVIPFAVLLLWMISEREGIAALKKGIAIGFILMMVVILLWPLAAGPAFWREFILRSNLQRAFHNPSWKTNTFFYILNFPAHFVMPAVLIPAAAYAIKRYSRTPISLYIVWFCTVFILFSVADTKRSSYILPLYPAASVIAGYGLLKAKKSVLEVCRRLALAVAATTGMAAAFAFAKHSSDIRWPLLMIAASLILVLTTALIKDPARAIVAGCALFAVGYTNLYQPIADRLYHSPRHCIERMKAHVDKAPLYVYGSLRANEYWYWGKRVIPDVEEALTTPYYFYTRRKKVILYGNYRRILCCSYQKERLCLYKVY